MEPQNTTLLVTKVIADILHHTRAEEIDAITEIAQQIKALAALAGDPGSVPSIYMVMYNHL